MHDVIEPKPVLLVYETYRAMIAGSVGSTMFRHFFARLPSTLPDHEGEVRDLVDGGALACAFYVTTILNHFELIDGPHLTVASTVKDLERSGWQRRTDQPTQSGSVIIWGPATQGESGVHKHIGFYLGDQQAMSNSTRLCQIVMHDVTFDGTRPIEAVYDLPPRVVQSATG